MGSEETLKRKADPDLASVGQSAAKRVRYEIMRDAPEMADLSLITIPHRSSYDDILTVIVSRGKLTKTFKVHKDLIAKRSPYFKSATAPDRWLEGKENIVRLTGHHPRTFEAYIECLYNPEADLLSIVDDFAKAHVDSFSTEPNFAKFHKFWTQDAMLQIFAEHWVLGDYLGDTTFKNRVIEKLHTDSELVLVWVNSTRYIVDNTGSTSGLYRWLVEQYHGMIVSASDMESKNKLIEKMPPSLLKEVLGLFAARSKQSDKVQKIDFKEFFDKEESG